MRLHTWIDYKKRTKERLRTVLSVEERILKRTAFHRCGTGLNETEFDDVIQELHTEGFLTIALSAHGKERLALMEPETKR